MKIAVLLCTYNGGNYLSAQIDSLLSQTYKDFTIFIHDDGSTDNTLSIIRSYQEKYPSLFKLLSSHQKMGPKNGFLWLLENTSASYYMFCDQDDVWLPTKIEDTFKRMKDVESVNPHKAVMIHTDLTIVDSQLNVINKSFWSWGRFNVDLNKKFRFCPIGNVFTGCTMMVNDKAKSYIFPVSEHASMHDEWIGLIISKHGVIENLKKQTILYRQHSKNVCSIGSPHKFRINTQVLINMVRWYYQKRELLDDLKYGSIAYAFANKLIYDVLRLFKVNH